MPVFFECSVKRSSSCCACCCTPSLECRSALGLECLLKFELVLENRRSNAPPQLGQELGGVALIECITSSVAVHVAQTYS